MKYSGFAYLLLMIASLCACAGSGISEPQKPLLVVEGWIEDGDFPVVLLTKTMPITGEMQQVDFEDLDYLVRYAKVTVSDGENSVVLTGKYDAGYMPPYIYTTSHLRGKVGKTYWLTVEYDDYHATAVTTIPSRAKVDTFKLELRGQYSSRYQITACFTDNPSEKNYYQFFTRVGTKSKQFMASYLGSIDDEVLNGYTEVPVYAAHQLMKYEYSPYFSVDDTVTVKFAQVDEVSFRFWDEYTKSQSTAGNVFFATSSSVAGNIKGGMGYWCGYGSTNYYFVSRSNAK